MHKINHTHTHTHTLTNEDNRDKMNSLSGHQLGFMKIYGEYKCKELECNYFGANILFNYLPLIRKTFFVDSYYENYF